MLLQQNYASGASDAIKRERKRELFDALQTDYAALKQSWGGYAGYDRFFATALTNAHLAAVGAYNDRVPAFDRSLAENGGDFPAFYAAVKRLAGLPKDRRDAALEKLQLPR